MHHRFITGIFCATVSCVILLCAGCAVQQFPFVRPVTKPSMDASAQRRAEEQFMKARACDRRGLFQMALHYYEEAYRLDPGSGALRELLVQRYVFSSRFKQAIDLVKGSKKENELSDPDKSLCASIYMRMNEFSHAAELLDAVKNKQNEELYTLGLLYESLGNIPHALASYRGYLARDPSSIALTLKVGALYMRLNKYDSAESLYVAAEKADKKNPRLYNGIGEVKLARGDTALALDFFKKAVMADSTFLDGLRNIAQVHLRKGNYADAIPYYEKLYANDSIGGLFGKTLALLYYYGKEPDKAKTLLQKLLSGDINDPELHFYLGLVYGSQDSFDLAAIEFGKTLAIRNNFSDAWLQLCYLDLRQKEYDRALGTAKHFTENAPTSGVAWRTLGYVYNVRKQYADAVPFLKKALWFDSLDAFAWFELGSALERTKEFNASVVAFKRVLAIKPDEDAAANYLGYMWAERGIKLDSARMLVENALARDSANGAYLDSYAWVFYQLGKIDSAFVYIKKAMRQINDDAVVYSHYGDILLKKGMEREALEAYKKSLKVDAKSEEAEAVMKKIKLLEDKSNNKK
ncbi:MAG TPA: tetratricopeptide repeat protein [Chitinivibrionales bacterium]|nr:tetratricopeptide repeat protein [Chitinivibrionales bacterium]